MSEVTKELMELVWGTKSSPGLSDTIFCRWTQGTLAELSPVLRESVAPIAAHPRVPCVLARSPCTALELDFLETPCLLRGGGGAEVGWPGRSLVTATHRCLHATLQLRTRVGVDARAGLQLTTKVCPLLPGSFPASAAVAAWTFTP